MPTKSSSSRAKSRAWRSSLRCHGIPNTVLTEPALRCGCMATITFSSAVMRPNSRMFWKVRAMPQLAILCGGRP